MMISLLLLFVVAAWAQGPRIESIDSILLSQVLKAPNDPMTANSPWQGPQDPALSKPQSHRVIYKAFAQNGPADTLTVRLSFNAAAGTALLGLGAPLLEQDPWDCAGAAGAIGSCRCNPPAHKFPFNQPMITTSNNFVAGNTLTLPVPVWNYFVHAPFPGQDPYLRTYRRICVALPGDNVWVDTNLFLAVVDNCATSATCGANANLNAQGLSGGVATLITNAAFAAPCNQQQMLGAFWATSGNARVTQLIARDPVAVGGAPALLTLPAAAAIDAMESGWCWGETAEMYQARLSRTTCCRTTGVSPIGVCIDTTVSSCCGWKPYDSRYERCCYSDANEARIDYLDHKCTCTANTFCPTGESCCQPTKYLAQVQALGLTATQLATLTITGTCFNPTGSSRCCTDGHLFDPAVSHCCPVTGVVSLNQPCPCNLDSDCAEGNDAFGVAFTNRVRTCCLQRFPRSWKEGDGLHAWLNSSVKQCDAFANWPEQQSPNEVQRCFGQCIDVEFQICCNGVPCSRSFDRCCNSTCCNRFTSTCMEGSRPGTRGFGNRTNPLEFGASYEVCSERECFTTRKAFWVFVMPVFWLVATLVSFAIVVIVARRATENIFELTEIALVFSAVVILFLTIPLYFSPAYKYGILACFISLFVILAAVLRSKALSLVAVFAVLLLLIYWIDPFDGNLYLALSGGRSVPAPSANPYNRLTPVSTSVVTFIALLQRSPSDCSSFYDFFDEDPMAHDMARWRNPARVNYGYCSRAWLATITIFVIVALLFILLALLLSIFSLAKKLVPSSPKGDITFEIRPEYEY